MKKFIFYIICTLYICLSVGYVLWCYDSFDNTKHKLYELLFFIGFIGFVWVACSMVLYYLLGDILEL